MLISSDDQSLETCLVLKLARDSYSVFWSRLVLQLYVLVLVLNLLVLNLNVLVLVLESMCLEFLKICTAHFNSSRFCLFSDMSSVILLLDILIDRYLKYRGIMRPWLITFFLKITSIIVVIVTQH